MSSSHRKFFNLQAEQVKELPLPIKMYLLRYPKTRLARVCGDLSLLSSAEILWVTRWLTLDMTPGREAKCAGCQRLLGRSIELIRHIGSHHLKVKWPDIRDLIDRRWCETVANAKNADTEFWDSPDSNLNVESLLLGLIESEIKALRKS